MPASDWFFDYIPDRPHFSSEEEAAAYWAEHASHPFVLEMIAAQEYEGGDDEGEPEEDEVAFVDPDPDPDPVEWERTPDFQYTEDGKTFVVFNRYEEDEYWVEWDDINEVIVGEPISPIR